MLLSDQAEGLGQRFAEHVIAENWYGLSQLFLNADNPGPAHLEAAFSWKNLLPKLMQAYQAETGIETKDWEVPAPTDQAVWNDVSRDNDYGPEPLLTLGQCFVADDEGKGPFIEIDFLPADDSGYDHCYRCILTMVDGDEPHVTGCEIELILD